MKTNSKLTMGVLFFFLCEKPPCRVADKVSGNSSWMLVLAGTLHVQSPVESVHVNISGWCHHLTAAPVTTTSLPVGGALTWCPGAKYPNLFDQSEVYTGSQKALKLLGVCSYLLVVYAKGCTCVLHNCYCCFESMPVTCSCPQFSQYWR